MQSSGPDIFLSIILLIDYQLDIFLSQIFSFHIMRENLVVRVLTHNNLIV